MMILIAALVIILLSVVLLVSRRTRHARTGVFFLLSFISAAAAGILIHRLLPGWKLLAADVGAGGAWIISAVYHFIYGIFTAAGAVCGVLVSCRLGTAAGTPAVVSGSVLAISLFNAGLSYFGPAAGFYSLMFLLMTSSFLAVLLIARLFPHGENRADERHAFSGGR